jgi:hypothetical protein
MGKNSSTGRASRCDEITFMSAVWLGVAGTVMLVTSVWAWNIADRASDTAVQTVRWLGPDFAVSPSTAALVLAAVSAAAASFIHSTAQFAPHRRHRALNRTDLMWFVLRPLNAALLGMVTVVLLRSGLISIGTTTDNSTAVAGFEAGAIAGLCTDRLITLIDRLARLGPRTPEGSQPTGRGAAPDGGPDGGPAPQPGVPAATQRQPPARAA